MRKRSKITDLYYVLVTLLPPLSVVVVAAEAFRFPPVVAATTSLPPLIETFFSTKAVLDVGGAIAAETVRLFVTPLP